MRIAIASALLLIGLGLVTAGCSGSATTVAYVDNCPVEMTSCRVYVPSDDCRMLRVEKSYPRQVVVGRPFTAKITVTNVSRRTVEDVFVYDSDAISNYQLLDSTPTTQPTDIDDRRVWNLGSLEPGQSASVIINGAAHSVGEVCSCIEVAVRPQQVCTTISVIQPALSLEQFIPQQQLVCDAIPARFVVSNVGTGRATNVKVYTELPDGWATADGQRTLSFTAATLDAGEVREFQASLKSANVGTYRTDAVATADHGLRAAANGSTTLLMTDLSVTIAGQQPRNLNEPYTQTIRVSNSQAGPAADTVLTYTMPEEAVFVTASEDGRFADGKVTWQLGTLGAGQSREFTVQLRGGNPGVSHSSAAVTSACGSAQAVGQLDAHPPVADLPAKSE